MTVENKQTNQAVGLQLYFYIMGGWLMLYDHLAVESLVKVWWEKRHNMCVWVILILKLVTKKKNFTALRVFFVTENDAKNTTDFLQYVTLI